MRFADYGWLWLLAGMHLAIGCGIALFPETRSDLAGGFILGSLVAQAALMAVVTVWLPWPLPVRLPIAWTGLAFSWFALIPALLREQSALSAGGPAVVLGGMIAGVYVAMVAAFAFAKLLTAWRLTDQEELLPAGPAGADSPSAAPSTPSESQYRIGHLLFWMALAAGVLAVARLLLPTLGFDRGPEFVSMILVYAIIALGSVLVAFPWFCAVLAPQVGHAWWGAAFVAGLWTPFVMGGQVGGVSLVIGPPFGPESDKLLTIFFLLNCSLLTVLGLSLLLLRAQGFRLANCTEEPAR